MQDNDGIGGTGAVVVSHTEELHRQIKKPVVQRTFHPARPRQSNANEIPHDCAALSDKSPLR